MRKIHVGAIQSADLPIPERCNCLSETYIPQVNYVYEKNILLQSDVTFNLLEEAGKMGLDAVVTGEDLCQVSHYIIDTTETNVFPALVNKSSLMAEERISAIAKKYKMNIIACYMKAYREKIYNLASLFDRNGEIIGEYRKTHLPPNETWQVTKGENAAVFQMDFGQVGVEICYDMMFPALSEVLSLKGAEIVFHPTAGYGWYDSIGEATVRTRANDNSFYLVTAKNYCYNGAGKSSVIDYWGQSLADAGFYPNVVVSAQIDLDIPKTQPDWHYQTGMTGEPQMIKRRIGERRPDIYSTLCDTTGCGQKILSVEEQTIIRDKVKKGIFHW